MKKLNLKKEILADLSTDELVVVGGAAGAEAPSAAITYGCTYTCVCIGDIEVNVSGSCLCNFTNRCTGC